VRRFLYSGSTAEALARCPPSHVFPRHEAHSEKAGRGTLGHGKLARFFNNRVALDDKRLSKVVQEVCVDVGCARGEAAFAVDVKRRKARLIGVDIDRKYDEVLAKNGDPPLSKYEIPTTFDIDGLKDGVPWARDWKFGVHSTPMQLTLQAVALTSLYPDAPEVDVGFVYIDLDNNSHEEDSKLVSLFDLDADCELLVKAIDSLEAIDENLKKGVLPSTAEGSWCQYCAAVPHCPSRMALVKALIPTLEVHDMLDALTPEQVGMAHMKLKQIKGLVEKMDDAIKERLEAEGSFPLPNGKKLILSEVRGREYAKVYEVKQLLKAKGCTTEEIGALFSKGKDYYQKKEVKR
jgi:hypothetical protein